MVGGKEYNGRWKGSANNSIVLYGVLDDFMDLFIMTLLYKAKISFQHIITDNINYIVKKNVLLVKALQILISRILLSYV